MSKQKGNIMANSNQNIETPRNFLYAVEKHFNIRFKWDLACVVTNAKCLPWCDDNLKVDWPLGWCWLNPPFGKLQPWVDKCVAEYQRNVKIVSIWPLSGDLNMVDVWKHAQVNIVHGRIWPEVRGCMLCVWDNSVRADKTVHGLKWQKKEGKLVKAW